MIDPPFTKGELTRMRAEREAKRCQECKRTKLRHWPYCSKADADVRQRYERTRQRLEYRRVTREMGCTCSESLAAQTHAPGCPYQAALVEELEKRHDADAGRPWI